MEWHSATRAFLEHLRQSRGSTDNTIMAYRNDLSQLANFLSERMPSDARWEQVTFEVLQQFVYEYLIPQNYTTSTMARKIAALRAFFKWLRLTGRIQDDPTPRLRSPKVERRQPRLLSEHEVRALFEATSMASPSRARRDRALLEVLYATGMRVSEAINLRVQDLDLERGEVRCIGRGERMRVMRLTPSAVEALRAYLEQRELALELGSQRTYVFLNPRGDRLTRQAVWQMTRHYAQMAGIEGEMTPHTLRHSRAAHLILSGMDVRQVREWLGHANLSTTQLYRQRLIGGNGASEPAEAHAPELVR